MLPLILVVLSIITHFLFFGWPPQVVFDEVYFATFVGDYAKSTYYFDIHPPFAKLLVKFFGDFLGATFDVDMGSIGNSLPWEIILMRLLPLCAGILLPVVVYFVCTQLKLSKSVAFFAGLLVIFENSLLIQSRFILLDSILVLLGFASILFYLLSVNRGRGKWFIVISALCAAAAFSIKWTGLTFPFLIFVLHVFRVRSWRSVFKFIFVYGGIGLAVYLSSFALHFAYLTHSGSGDDFMSDRFQKTLIGSAFEHDPSLKPKGYFGKVIELNMEMLDANRHLKATHPYSSVWYTWPLMIRPVFYWHGTHTDGGNDYLYLLGNPLVYWGGFFSILCVAWNLVRKKHRDKAALFIVFGFLINWLPFMFIGRVMFIYHYETALVFSILAAAYCVQNFISDERRNIVMCSIVFLCCGIFVFFAPLTYGLYLSDAALNMRMWLPTWR